MFWATVCQHDLRASRAAVSGFSEALLVGHRTVTLSSLGAVHTHYMDSRATYLRQVRQFELTVIEFGRRVARQQAMASPDRHRALDVAVDALLLSPLAEPDDLRRIRLLEDVDFHVRHIARLLEGAAISTLHREPQQVLGALELALSALQLPTASELARLDGVLEQILEGAERPLLRNLDEATPHARIRSAALHVLAIADSARFLNRNPRSRGTRAVGGPIPRPGATQDLACWENRPSATSAPR